MAASTNPRPQDFPVYFHWHFNTSSGGDFETLVSILKPIVVKPEMGTLAMDIHSPGFGLEGVSGSATVGFEGALKPPTFQAAPFPATTAVYGENPGDRKFVDRLREVLNLSADLTEEEGGVNKASEVSNPFYEGSTVDDPIVAPPTYGYWHALLKRLGEAGNPAWSESLNLDPRRRAAAGIGTQSVKDNQEDLMHRAWQQVEQINEANRRIREGILAREVASSIYFKHVRALPDDKFLHLTAAMQGLTKRSDAVKTARYEIKDSRIPLAAQSAAFRKMLRPQGKLNRVLNLSAESPAALQQNILKNFNIGGENNTVGVAAAVLKSAPESAMAAGSIINFVQSASVKLTNDAELVARQTIMKLLAKANLTPSVVNVRSQLTNLLAQEQGISPQARNLAKNLINGLNAKTKEDGLQVLSVSKASYEAVFGSGANNKHGDAFVLKRAGETTNLRPVSAITTFSEAQAFVKGMQALESNVNAFQPPAVRPQLATAISDMRQDLQTRLHPGYTLDLKVRSRIRLWIDGALQALPQLKPVMKYPVFPEPVYKHARKLSQDYILPNVAKLAKNSITLMLSNQSFIESFMSGMNHEMSRELLWREFPTDQRGSYFRQFWDASDNILENDPEKKLDIKEMHKWKSQLGAHATRSGENLVLVVRGDLFIKYPNTIVYAQKAAYDPTNPAKPRQLAQPENETNVRFPIFSAELEPDIFLFGFALGVEEARGQRIRNPAESTAGKNPGWFFAFKERPGQIKFGLDDYQDPIGGTTMPSGKPATWPDLTWEHLVGAPAELNAYILNFSKNITITAPPAGQPNPGWAANAADMASILFQNPVIFARHADEMLEG